jgi:chaperonin GroES
MFSVHEHLKDFQTTTRVTRWQARNDIISVLRFVDATRTAGGIEIPDEAKEVSHMGIVLAIGPGLYDAERRQVLPVEVEVGDVVVFGKYAGTTYRLPNTNVAVLAMRSNAEFLFRCAWADIKDEIVEHLIDEATTKEQIVYHIAGDTVCEHCGKDTRSVDYIRALHYETTAQRDERWERVNIERGQAAARLAEEKRLIEDAARAAKAAEPPAVEPPAEATSNLIAEERARLLREKEAPTAVAEG